MITGVQQLFRFRLISRGEKANRLTQLAVRALQWCHPGVHVVVVDANDEPELKSELLPGVELIHIVPSDDAIATRVGRGSRKHIFYWRHSPQVLEQVPCDTEFTAYMDSDILLMRPMDLSSLVYPLQRGRIGVSVDESMLAYTGLLQERTHAILPVLEVPGACGPLLQTGLVFSHKTDDGGLYQEFWRLAETAAVNNLMELLPFDDMTLLTSLLTQGGKLWERWLPLGHEWNYITAAGQDPGVFAVGAHYGGFRAKDVVLTESSHFMAPDSVNQAWGSTSSEVVDGRQRFRRGIISGTLEGDFVRYRLSPPFAISWNAPPESRYLVIEAKSPSGHLGTMLIYVDGHYHSNINGAGLTQIRNELCLEGGCVITVIAAPEAQADADVVELWRSFSHKNNGN